MAAAATATAAAQAPVDGVTSAINTEWYLNEDGSLSVNDTCQAVYYHSNLNTILVVTSEPAVKVIDVNSGSLLQKSNLSAESGSQIHAAYINKYHRLLISDGRAICLRKDHCGMLLLDTILQVPVSKPDDIVKIELPFAEALKLLKCLFSVHLPSVDSTEEFIKELDKSVFACQAATRKNHKLAKWCTVCLELPHCVIKSVCSSLVQELKRVNRLVPALAVASAINERLGSLLSSSSSDRDSSGSGPVDRVLMYSEAARKETFVKWPHMTYKWALPDQMAQAGFYHQPNSTGDDRALCFTCNVCLVCWEPTDEPWSEHERHSPSCPFVKGEYTQNVPLTVSYATSPAEFPGERMERIHCLSTSSCPELMATATRSGQIIVWNVSKELKKVLQFCIDPTDSMLLSKRLDHARFDDCHCRPTKEAWGEQASQARVVNLGEKNMSRQVQSSGPTTDSVTMDEMSSVEELLQTFRPSKDVQTHKLCILGPNCSYANNSQCRPALVVGLSVRKCDFGFPASSFSNGTSNLVQALNDMNQSTHREGPLDIMKLDECSTHNIYSKQHFVPFILVYDIHPEQAVTSRNTCSNVSPGVPSKSQPSTSGSLKEKDENDSQNAFSDTFYNMCVKPSLDQIGEFVIEMQQSFLNAEMKLNDSSSSATYSAPVNPVAVSHPSPKWSGANVNQQQSNDVNSIPVPTPVKSKTSAEQPSEGLLKQCIELPECLNDENFFISELVPSFDGEYLIVAVNKYGSAYDEASTTEEGNSCESDVELVDPLCDRACGALLLYKVNSDTDIVTLNDVPAMMRTFSSTQDNIVSVLVLPSDDNIVQDDNVCAQASEMVGPVGSIVVTTVQGKVVVYRLSDLQAIAEFLPKKDEKFISAAYLSSIDRICACTEVGTLSFLQLCASGLVSDDKEVEDCNADDIINRSLKQQNSGEKVRDSESCKDDGPDFHVRAESFLINKPFTSTTMNSLYELTQFENLTPRFSVTVPPCWTEIQQEQKQRRHPQHLQQQGEAMQHTRSWRLQSDSITWDEHLFEISLSKPCCVGHLDFKFNLHPSLSLPPPKIQVTLLKQVSGGISRQMNYTRTSNQREAVDTAINFNIKSESATADEVTDEEEICEKGSSANPVLTEDYLEDHNAEILCGPIDISSCIDLSGQSGIVTLTSPALLSTKCRTFLLHIKALNIDKDASKSESSGVKSTHKVTQKRLRSKSKLGGSVPSLQAMLDQYITPGSTVDRLATSAANKKMELKGCDWFHEVSVTIRRTRKTNISQERLQRCAILETPSFHRRLLMTACNVDIEPNESTNFNEIRHSALDILIWVAAIQMNSAVDSLKASILSLVQSNLTLLIDTSIIQGNRTIARKCCKLLILCIEYSKQPKDSEMSTAFSCCLLQSLLDCLPNITKCQSSGALRWFFLLLNRVKCLDASSVGLKALALLSSISKQMQQKSNSYHSILQARFGLYGTPFDPELFEFDPPTPQKPTSTVLTYASVVTGGPSANSTNGGNVGASSSSCMTEDIDFRDLLNMIGEKSSSTSRLSWLPQNQQMTGLLEVEPLHFICHAASDGTKMEKMETASSNYIGAGSLLPLSNSSWHDHNSTSSNNNLLETSPYNNSKLYPFPKGGSDLSPVLNSLVSSIQQKQNQLIKLKKQKQKMEQKLVDDGSSTSLPVIVSSPSNAHTSSYQPTPTPKTTPLFMTPPLTPPSENNFLGNAESDAVGPPVVKLIKPPNVSKEGKASEAPISSSPWYHLLQPPSQQMLVIERMHSGARRFVVLDFGHPILLTDLMIPCCPDLVSLSVDVWVQSEEYDGQRLIVSTDIGIRSLVISDLQPPAYCQYLKITIIGRYGMSTTRCRIPIGYFYGHTYILPWERIRYQVVDKTEERKASTSVPCDPTNYSSQIQAQVTMLNALQEDIHCRYSLACNKLQTLLQPYIHQESANSSHTHYHLQSVRYRDKSLNDEDKKVFSIYDECIQLQQQLNLVCQAIVRLHSSNAVRTKFDPTSSKGSLHSLCSDKLRVIADSLLDTLIGLTCSSPSIPQLPRSLSVAFDKQICSVLFANLCMNTTCPTQLNASTLLVRMCATQPWWGSFLASTFQSLFTSYNNRIFPQDRIFILLTYLGQKSLSTGHSAVLESFLNLLSETLESVYIDQGNRNVLRGLLDLPFVGWILLFLSSCLDASETLMSSIAADAENEAANTKSKEGNSNRWTFIQGEAAMQKNSLARNKNSSRSYRRKLQKRLMHHKQRIEDLEFAKKAFLASTKAMSPIQSNIGGSIEAAVKQQEEAFAKTLKQHQSKHFKDMLQIRRTEGGLLGKTTVLKNDQPSSQAVGNQEADETEKPTLSYNVCITVAQRLVALLLHMDFTSCIDLLLLVCKVLSKVCTSTRPCIKLSNIMTEEQLLELLMIVVRNGHNYFSANWGHQWASHAITCLLLDILEGERTDVLENERKNLLESERAEGLEGDHADLPEPTSTLGATAVDDCWNSEKKTLENILEDQLDTSYLKELKLLKSEDLLKHQVKKLESNYAADATPGPSGVKIPSTSNLDAGSYMKELPMLIDTDDSSDEFNTDLNLTSEITEGLNMDKSFHPSTFLGGSSSMQKKSSGWSGLYNAFKQCNSRATKVYKSTDLFSSATHGTPSCQLVSTAMDCRLEQGVETTAELRLKIMSSLDLDTLHNAIHSSLPTPPENSVDLTNADEPSFQASPMEDKSTMEMLSSCFDSLFMQLRSGNINVEFLLSTWLSLNMDTNNTPVVPLSSAAQAALLSVLAWNQTTSLRVWCLFFQCLTLNCNTKIDHPAYESSTSNLLSDSNFFAVLMKFLSGSSFEKSSKTATSTVGPMVVQAFNEFMVRLQFRCDIITPTSILGNQLKELLLKLVQMLVGPSLKVWSLRILSSRLREVQPPQDAGAVMHQLQPSVVLKHELDRKAKLAIFSGPISQGHGPLDIQGKIIDTVLHLNFERVDINVALNITESVTAMVHNYISNRESINCCSHNESWIDAASCFGGLFAGVFRSNQSDREDSPAGWVSESRDMLFCSVLKLVCQLVRSPLDASSSLPESMGHLGGQRNTLETGGSNSQTDEHKTACGAMSCSHFSSENEVKLPCIADKVLSHQAVVNDLLSSLSMCSGSSMAILLGSGSSSPTAATDMDRFVFGEPVSVGDGVFHLLCSLNAKASNVDLILQPVYIWLSSTLSSRGRGQSPLILSEPLIWFLLRLLDCSSSLSKFHELGGIELVAENLVRCHSSLINSHPSLVSMIMQHLSLRPSLMSSVPSSSSSRKYSELESLTEGLNNFAPLGVITSSNPTAQPADGLIHSVPPHPRARTPSWSYHFYPEENWIDLTITLPCAVLLHEILIQPHLTSLATCPSAVSVDISRGNHPATLTPVCSPQPTSGLTFIRLVLSKPEIVTVVCLRLHKPRDSTNMGLSQILLIGSTTFGESVNKYTSYSFPSEEVVARSSLGWLRLLHHCLTVNPDCGHFIAAAASVNGMLESCCSLLQTPALWIYLSYIEKVLLVIGQHSDNLGLDIIKILLKHCSWTLQYNYVPNTSKANAIPATDAIMDILYTLCTSNHDTAFPRVRALLEWLNEAILSRTPAINSSSNGASVDLESSLSPSYIHCIAAILWQCHEQHSSDSIADLLDSNLLCSLCDWSLSINNINLRQALDSILCSVCYIKPDYFQLVLNCLGLTNNCVGSSSSLTDQQKNLEATSMFGADTDDFKQANHFSLQDFHYQQLTSEKLTSLATVCQSPPIVKQLLDCGFMSMLTQVLLDYCASEISRKSYEAMMLSEDRMTDFDKAGIASQSKSDKAQDQELVISILQFFTKVAGDGTIRDWLGGTDGSSWWLPLLSVICDSNVAVSNSTSILTILFGDDDDQSRHDDNRVTRLENASIDFLATCCWGHPQNQQLLAEVLCQVICKERSNRQDNTILGISGFTRRLILQLLLENEKILVYVKSPPSITLHKPPTAMLGDGGLGFLHPQFSCGHNVRTVYVNMQTTCSEIISTITDATGLATVATPHMKKKLDKHEEKSSDDKADVGELGIELANHLSLAAGALAKDKRQKDNVNAQKAARPPTRRGTIGSDLMNMTSSLHVPSSHGSLALFHDLLPGQPLPDRLSLAQLMVLLDERGQSLSFPYLALTIKNKKNSETFQEGPSKSYGGEIPADVLMDCASLPTTLQIFASMGGLSLLAQHLPLLYPEISRQISPKLSADKPSENSKQASSLDSEWVKVEAPEDLFDDFPEYIPQGGSSLTATSTNSMPPPSIPPYSLAAFGLFLRLPGYAEVLLKERQKAQCLLRLALGVTDDADGSDIFSSNIDPSLPTLPFSVLQQLFDSTPLTTDDGLLLRKMALDVGAVHLLLACLSVLSHQNSEITLPGFQHEAILAATKATSKNKGHGTSRSDDKGHLYWAKGTGFGTGSTTQSWDVEQHIMRQKCEEEHVTCLLLVLASYINPEGHSPMESSNNRSDDPVQINGPIPPVFSELLTQSCLLPAISSYLRNDSVLDMARHVPLYQSLLKLLRALASSPQVISLLLPHKNQTESSMTILSIRALLMKMKLCVDTYTSRLKANKMRISSSKGKGKRSSNVKEETDEETEGLALLIPDIQETARIVDNATKPLLADNESCDKDGETAENVVTLVKEINKSIEQQYMEVLKPLQFDTFEMISEDENGIRFTISHHFESNMRTGGDHGHPSRARRLAQETVTLSTSLPLSYNSSVFVRCDQDRLDIMKVLITGPADTPYANGCFEFDVYFPPDYPNLPMLINLETTGHHSVRFNPNLYNDGKVCLSILNTWHGRPEEKWNSNTSSFLQVLVSIQSLILVADPYFNEPGYERSRGTPSGNQSSREYDANIRQATIKWGILEQLRNPCPCFKSIIHKHLWMKRGEILKQCEVWIADMESTSSERRSGKTISFNTQALKRHTAQLQEEFAKMKPPEGLENWTSEMTSFKVGSPTVVEGASIKRSDNVTCMNGDLSPEEEANVKLLNVSKMHSLDLNDVMYNMSDDSQHHNVLITGTSPTESASQYMTLSEQLAKNSIAEPDSAEDKESIC